MWLHNIVVVVVVVLQRVAVPVETISFPLPGVRSVNEFREEERLSAGQSSSSLRQSFSACEWKRASLFCLSLSPFLVLGSPRASQSVFGKLSWSSVWSRGRRPCARASPAVSGVLLKKNKKKKEEV